MSNLILYHGSPNIIEKPLLGYGKAWNDYGQGFYCTKNLQLAKEWAVSEETNGYANRYSLDDSDLRTIDITDYTMLHWLAILVANRKFSTSTPVMKRGKDWLLDHFLIDTSSYDLIKGYRADDSYFSFAKAFLTNQISYVQLSLAMRLGDLGEQIMLKSQKAFDSVHFEGYEDADFHKYFPEKKKRDEEARSRFRKILEDDDMDGIFMRDIIREQIKENDARIQ